MTGEAVARSRARWGVPDEPRLNQPGVSEVSLDMGRAPTWGALLRGHHIHQTARNLAPSTIRVYRYLILDVADRHPRPDLITADHLLDQMTRGSRGPDGMKTARSAYRSLFGWAHKTGRLPENPAADLPAVKQGRRLPRPAPDPVIERSLRVADDREQFMIELGAYAGLRDCETARVHEHDWDGDRQLLLVHGKGAKQRIVPVVDERLVARLDALRGWAFPNRYTGEPLTAGHVCKLLSDALAGTWTGHTLRHRFGTEALEQTKDLLAVAEVMGHESVETTRIYTRVSTDRLFAVSRGAGRPQRGKVSRAA